MIEFYYLSGSPFAWRVWLALESKGLNYRKVDLSFEKGDLRSESFLSLNPRGKIPVIVDEGVALSESSVILEYLDEQYPDGLRLFPRDVVKRAQLRKLINEVDIYFDLANRRLLNSVFFTAREKWDEDKISRSLSGVMKELDYFETAFIDSLSRRAAAIFEFSMFPLIALMYRLDSIKDDLNFAASAPRWCQDWYEWLSAEEIFRSTWPSHWELP